MEELNRRVLECFQIIGNSFKKDLAQSDLSDSCSMKECGLLEFLSYSPKTMSEIAYHLNLTPGTITSQIDNLIAKKLVIRKHDSEDRRKIFISLSSKGEKLANSVLITHVKFSKELLSNLSNDEKIQFVELLEKASHHLK